MGAPAKTRKVRVAVVVEVDVDAWMNEYGVDRADVPADVRRYVQDGITAHLDSLGLLAS